VQHRQGMRSANGEVDQRALGLSAPVGVIRDFPGLSVSIRLICTLLVVRLRSLGLDGQGFPKRLHRIH
jgi:hypothetical protein